MIAFWGVIIYDGDPPIDGWAVFGSREMWAHDLASSGRRTARERRASSSASASPPGLAHLCQKHPRRLETLRSCHYSFSWVVT